MILFYYIHYNKLNVTFVKRINFINYNHLSLFNNGYNNEIKTPNLTSSY